MASQTLNPAENLIEVSIRFDFRSLASGEEEKRIRTRIQTLMIPFDLQVKIKTNRFLLLQNKL